MIATWGAAQRFTPAKLSNLEAWFQFNNGITVTGSGVSQWDDQSGNGRHLKQGTDTNRPALQGDGTILFDGVDNFLKCDAFTLNQPETIYILGRQVTWTNGDCICEGNSNTTGRIVQNSATPQLNISAGNSVASNTDWTVNTYMAVVAVFNGASSSLRVNNNAEVTGNAGAGNMGGFSLGANANPGGFSNIQVKEVIIYSAAHDAATRDAVIAYLLTL